MIPLHATLSIGQSLPPDYFSPGTTIMNGKEVGSLWAIAYWKGEQFGFERAGLGEKWVRVG